MTPDEIAAEVEKKRRNREQELFFALLALADDAESDASVIVKHGGNPTQALQNIFKGTNGTGGVIPLFAQSMAEAHLDAVKLYEAFAPKGTPDIVAPSEDDLTKLYTPNAQAAADAMVQTSYSAIAAKLATAGENGEPLQQVSPETAVSDAFDSIGYTAEATFGLEAGAERSIVLASNVGLTHGAIELGNAIRVGLRHVSILDNHTTQICWHRNGLILLANDPFWAWNTPQLHWKCRSVLAPVFGDFEISTWRPSIPPDPGFGLAPPWPFGRAA